MVQYTRSSGRVVMKWNRYEVHVPPLYTLWVLGPGRDYLDVIIVTNSVTDKRTNISTLQMHHHKWLEFMALK